MINAKSMKDAFKFNKEVEISWIIVDVINYFKGKTKKQIKRPEGV